MTLSANARPLDGHSREACDSPAGRYPDPTLPMTVAPGRPFFQPAASRSISVHRFTARPAATPWARLAAIVFGLGLFLGAGFARAASPASPPEPGQTVIRHYNEMWTVPAGPQTVYPLHSRFCVLCYYAEWNVLWVLWDGEVHYVEAGPGPLPLRSGEWVDADGFCLPASQKIVWARTRLTPVSGLAAPPAPFLGDHAAQLAHHEAAWGQIQGIVDTEEELDSRHIQLNVVFGDTGALVYIRLGPTDPIPLLRGAAVRLTGVLAVKRDNSGKLSHFEFWCASAADVTRTGTLAADPRFATPVLSIDAAGRRTDGALVHVMGTVYQQVPGRSLTLRDQTGQIEVLSHQAQLLRLGDTVEAIGRPAHQGVTLLLRDGLFRPTTAAVPQPRTEVLLRLADEVRTLRPAEVSRGAAARISGIVTWSAPGAPFFFAEDASGGLKVLLPPALAKSPPVVATGATIEGRVEPGEFVPALEARQILPGANLSLPPPDTISWEQAMTGAEYGRWVRMQGYVRDVRTEAGRTLLDLTAPGGEFTAVLPAHTGARLTGAIVKLDGVCDVIANQRRQLAGFQLLVPGEENVTVVEATPADPFAAPVESIGDLLRYSANTPLIRRVQVIGTVLLDVPGRVLFIDDGTDALTVLSRASQRLQPGARVAVVGIPGQEGGRLIMREAVYRKIGDGPAPVAVSLHHASALQGGYEGHLVRATGRLLSDTRTGAGLTLQLQNGSLIFSARLDRAEGNPPRYEAGSELRVTGVYQAIRDEYRHPRSFVLNLRSPDDIRILARPSWWTPRRVLWAGAALLAGVLLIGAWGIVVSRKNEQLEAVQRALRQANERLEARVDERTRALQLEVQQRRQSEEALAKEQALLRTLIDNLPVFLYVKDAAGRFVTDNLPHARLLGAPDCDAVAGKTEADFWPAELAREAQESDRRVLETGQPIILDEEPFALGSESRWHATTKVPLRDASGKITGLIAIARDITARKAAEAERENLNRRLLEASRQAGMAEVATGVLHNVGNVLTSVNVSATLATDIVARSRSEKLGVLVTLLTRHQNDLATFFATDPRAQRIPEYLRALLEQIRSEHRDLLKELASLHRNIDHIKDIVAMQQTYAKTGGFTESVPLVDIVEDALRINQDALANAGIQVERDIQAKPVVSVERPKVLQILVNLISNARHACLDGGNGDRRITVRVAATPSAATIEVADNGVGITAENLTRVFVHGFTTRKNGHGFGLHSGAIAAKELGGALRVTSHGTGQGATFILELPIPAPGATKDVAVS